jgi:hypothetical protein
MSGIDATQVLPAPVWDDPRVHLLDDVWLLTIFAILLAVGVPWFVSSFDIDAMLVALGLLALAGIHIAFTALAAPTRAPAPWRRRALAVLHALGVVVIGYIWRHAGSLQNPVFLVVFVLPIIGAIFLSRWQPYVMAAIAVVVVTIVAMNEAPELRWYASGLSGTGAWLAAIFDRQGATAPPFPGFYAPTGYFVVVLEVFAILAFACAAAAEYLGTVFDRLYTHIAVARAEAERGQELWATLIERLPLPALLADVNTLQVLCASEELSARFCAGGAPAVGHALFDSVHFSYPEIIQELIGGTGGTVRAVLHVGVELRVADVYVQHIAHRGRRFALLLIADVTEAFGVRAALDADDHAALVIDGQARILAFNKPALALFPELKVGTDASALLSWPGATGPWWQPSLSGRKKMHVRIMPRIFQVTSSAVALPGEDERVYVIAFLPVARAEVANPDHISNATPLDATMVRPR